jgi:hypothetical protein
MTGGEEFLVAALRRLPERPVDGPGNQPAKKRYSELMSQAIAAVLAEELRKRGLKGARPGGDGDLGVRGAERRMSGGIGAKKVDVTCATEESGLILGLSVKCITSKDPRTGNYQKNLTNRRGDMLVEAVTLHRRFPYAVLGGFVFFDKGAVSDGSQQRSSTFSNAHRAFRIFSGRNDPAGRDEQYERLYLSLVEATPFGCSITLTHAGEPASHLSLDRALDSLLRLVVERDPDMYALLGPNGEIDPDHTVSPVSVARVRTSGIVEQSKSPLISRVAEEESSEWGSPKGRADADSADDDNDS